MVYMQGGEPFFYAGRTGVGCVVTHGFMSSPNEVRWLGQSLAAQGHSVYGVRMAGHGSDYRDMQFVSWRAWLFSVLDAYHILSSQCDQVFLVGHSLGGTVSLLASTQAPVAGVAMLASPILQYPYYWRIFPLLKYIYPFSYQPDPSDLAQYIRAEQTRRDESVLGRVRYDWWSLAGIREMIRLMENAHAHLEQVKAPLLLVNARHDPVVGGSQAQIIASKVKSSILEQHWLEQSGHNIPQDTEHERAFEWVNDFVRKLSE